MDFLISEVFRLEIHWEKVSYTKDGVISLAGCYLSGPALKDAMRLNKEDFISLDFSNQYLIFVDNYYVAKLSWNGVEYEGDKIYLSDVILTNKYLNSIPKLNDKDYFVVDTSAHDTNKMFVETHNFNMYTIPFSYKSYLIKEDGSYMRF